MPAVSKLCVETWQVILRYAISVPDFLDPDAYEGVLSTYMWTSSESPLNDESAYWRTERTRHRLQRVAKSWDRYLRQFEHRFVRMLDVVNGAVPPSKLKNAVRISFGLYKHIGLGSRWGNFSVCCVRAMESVESTLVNIVDMKEQANRDLMRLFPKLQHTKTLLWNLSCTDPGLAEMSTQLPHLRHVYGLRFGYHDTTMAPIFQNLFTLSISISPRTICSRTGFILPSLQHLRISIWPTAGSRFTRDVLRLVGRQLRSFHICGDPPIEKLEGIWNLCPKMESHRTCFELDPPPLFHPIRVLILDSAQQLDDVISLLDWPNLQRVKLNSFQRDRGDMWWEEFILSRDNIRIEDRSGLTLSEYRAGSRSKGVAHSSPWCRVPANFTS